MKIRSIVATVAAATGLALTATTMPATAAPGNTSLAQVLAADGTRFDGNRGDFDILDRAVSTVLAAKPDSPVAVLADGSTRVTAFLPTDQAFRVLVEDLTGTHVRRERAVFRAVASTFDVDTIEAVLLYHVVPGATIKRAQARQADGTPLQTALEGARVRVDVRGKNVFLKDLDTDARNPRIVAFNINVGNRQIGHGIDRVLRPVDL